MHLLNRTFYCIFIFTVFALHATAQDNTDSLQEDESKLEFAIYPAIGYTPETSLQLGFIAFIVHKDPNQVADDSSYYRPTSISPYFLYTFNNQILTAFDLDIYLNNGININSNLRYYKFPDFFYGLGNDNSPEDVETYTDEYFRFEGRALKPLTDKIYGGIRYYFQHNNIYDFEEGKTLEQQTVNGTSGGWTNGIGPAFLYDSRNSTLYPTKGSMIRLEATFYGGTFFSDYTYSKYLLDVRTFKKIKNEKNVFGWQFYSMLTAGTDVPFYNLSIIAGDEYLRGIENANLYLDRQAWYTQVEYRRDLFWRLGGVVFAGVGDVAYDIGDFNLRETKYVVGVGGRFQALKDEKFNIRLDIGLARHNQMAFYLSIREAF